MFMAEGRKYHVERKTWEEVGGGAWPGLFEGSGISHWLRQSARYTENAGGL